MERERERVNPVVGAIYDVRFSLMTPAGSMVISVKLETQAGMWFFN